MNTKELYSDYEIEQDIDAEEAREISQLLQAEIIKNIKQLSLEGLKTIAEFSAYLVDKEEKEATQEIKNIPNIKQKL